MNETTHYQKNGEMILNRAKDYYENNKELLRERAKINTGNYLIRKKTLKRVWKKRYHNMSEENKKKIKRISKKLT